MNQFEKNIISIYRDQGKEWLVHLPKLVASFASLWSLDGLEPVHPLSYNYVLKGRRSGKPIVLKLSLDGESLEREVKALRAFSGFGAVSVLGFKEGGVLLEGAIPGTSLKTATVRDGIQVACEVAQKLHQAPVPQESTFPHIKEWLAILDREWDIPKELLHRARRLKGQLSATQDCQVLLHGDLHRDNILSNGSDWLVIDPKGVIGEPIHEVWAFIEHPETELPFVAQFFGFDLNRVTQWYYIHLILAACWQVEDGLDPQVFLRSAEALIIGPS